MKKRAQKWLQGGYLFIILPIFLGGMSYFLSPSFEWEEKTLIGTALLILLIIQGYLMIRIGKKCNILEKKNNKNTATTLSLFLRLHKRMFYLTVIVVVASVILLTVLGEAKINKLPGLLIGLAVYFHVFVLNLQMSDWLKKNNFS